MRPIERGTKPTNNDGSPSEYARYDLFRRNLIQRLGQYCSYCNQKLPASLAVEHVRPKVISPELELEWENFLLACTNCNSIKSDCPINLELYLWPDVHNTHKAFVYSSDGKVHVNSELTERIKTKAQKMLDLVGLQRYPNNPTASDRRWINRKEAYLKASMALTLYKEAAKKGAATEFEKVLGLWSSDNGFFSIWLNIFNDFPTVKKEIIKSFVGTAKCFDEKYNATNRTPEL